MANLFGIISEMLTLIELIRAYNKAGLTNEATQLRLEYFQPRGQQMKYIRGSQLN